MFTQLNAPINVFSKALTCSASVGRAIIHLLLSLWTQPLNEFCRITLKWVIFKKLLKMLRVLFKYFTENYRVLEVINFIELT